MCLKPIYVTIRPKVYQIDDFRGKAYEMPVPCGQCAQCLKQRQGQYRSRVLLNSQKFPYSYFVTLTYNEDSLPVYARPFEIDSDSGEIKSLSDEDNTYPSCLSRELPYYRSVRERLNACPKSADYCRQYYEDIDVGFSTLRYVYTDSLDYSDIQKFIKRIRADFDYKLGDDAPKLSYLICGEYGPKTHRPHWHCLLMFDRPVEYFKRIVKEHWPFGHVRVDAVACSSTDFGRVGSYISKYIVKGKPNEEKAALDGFCVMPRVRSSLRFGTWLTDQQLSYLRCWDMYGPYSMFDYKKVITDERQQTFFEEMARRFRCLFPSSSTPVPKSVVLRLFSVRTPSGNRCWSPLYLAFRDFKRNVAVSNHDAEYRQYCSDFGYTENTLDSFVAFEKHKETLYLFKQAKFEQNAKEFYARSKL